MTEGHDLLAIAVYHIAGVLGIESQLQETIAEEIHLVYLPYDRTIQAFFPKDFSLMAYEVELVVSILNDHFALPCTVVGNKVGEGMCIFVKD